MIRVSSLQSVSALGKYFRDSGYDLEHLTSELNLGDGLYANLENLDPLLAKTEGDSILAVLARLFFVCWPVDEARCRRALSAAFLDSCFECGLLVEQGGNIAPSACLFPFRSQLIACDPSRTRGTMVDMVTGPSASTQYPARLAIGGSNETTLDLGTGTGALAIEAVRYSRKVIGTDINPRCLQYGEFNAALNGVSCIEWRLGDAFAPVTGERFSRIVANPPFFLTPSHTFVYSDSPLELDGFTERLARECCEFLEEGGFYQMICEWVDLAGDAWEQRLRKWTQHSGCDVLVVTGPRMTPLNYAEKRSNEARLMQAGVASHTFNERFGYLAERKVTQVIAGVITMRKRSGGSNWVTVVNTEPVGDEIGYDVRARFDALTFLSASSRDQVMASKLRLAKDVILNRTSVAESNHWHPKSIDLIKPMGLIDKLGLDETVSLFIPLFNGDRTVSKVASVVSENLEIGLEEAQQRCYQLARRLLQSNFVVIT